MLSLYSLLKIVNDVTYKDWRFRVMEKGDGFLVQAVFKTSCAKTGKKEKQSCRKWYVSAHSCRAEVVRALYKAVEAGEIHEVQEWFKYKGVAVFNPHLNPEDIVTGVQQGRIGNETRVTEAR